VKFGRREIGKIVRCLYDKNNIFASLFGSRYYVDRAQNVSGPAPRDPRMYSGRFSFNPNRFTFGGVIPERVNTIKTGRKVFLAFG